MSDSASEKDLQGLHALVAKVLTSELEKTQKKDADPPSPQLLAQAIKFLKDNGIEPAKDVNSKVLDELTKEVNEVMGDPANVSRLYQ